MKENMYKVKINNWEYDYDNDFETYLPKIPNIGEQVGYWFMGDWLIATIHSIIYEFDQENNFLLVEINVTGKV